MLELERTYLAKYLPEGFKNAQSKEIIDLFVPAAFPHPKIRIRKNGDNYEITKKEPLKDDPSQMLEQTIKITPEEFAELSKLPGKGIRKIRHKYDCNGRTAEIDVFQDKLAGLVIVDFEFETERDKNAFRAPDFCLAEITTEQFTAGGMLCGKSYVDLEETLNKYGYKKLSI